MSLVVQKFGGTSVADVDRIRHVAGVVAATRAAGHELVVVVSAMAGETNRLLALARQAARTPEDRESDVLVATGEQVTAALLALTLQDTGVDARSFLGHQIRIETDSAFSRARIVRVDVDRLRRALGAGTVAVVAGFQGVDGEGSITTLGRGGSGTSAVAPAAPPRAEPAYDRDEAKLTILRVPDRPGVAARLFGPIARANIVVDMIIQNASADGTTDLTFTVARGDYAKARALVDEIARQIGAQGVTGQTDVAKVSVAGIGMRTHAGIAARMFEVLGAEGINVQMISTSEIKVSVVVDEKYTELAVRALHDAFIGGPRP